MKGTATLAREWLAAQDGPRTSRQIADAIGREPIKVQWAVGVMLRDGLLRRVSAAYPRTYEVAREAMSKDETTRLAIAARIARQRSQSEAARAAKQAAADARKREATSAREARRRQQAEQRRAYQRERYIKRLEALSAHAAAIASQPEAVRPRAQTVDEFLSMGGKIERLQTAWGT